MLLAGSNNCYEIGRGGRSGRRVRSWEANRYYNRKGKISEKPEVILKKLNAELTRLTREHLKYQKANYPKEEWVKPAHIREHFGYYSSIVVGSGRCYGTSWNRWRSLFANGIKNAVTIEELDKLGVSLNIYYYSYNDDSPNGKPASVDIRTEQEYFIELKKWREWQASSGKMFYITFHPSSTDAVLHRLRMLRDSKRKPPREKTRVEQDHFFLLASGSYALIKYTARGYRYSFHKENGGGKRYRTEQEAEKYRQLLVTKGRPQADIWKVERVEQACSFMV